MIAFLYVSCLVVSYELWKKQIELIIFINLLFLYFIRIIFHERELKINVYRGNEVKISKLKYEGNRVKKKIENVSVVKKWKICNILYV